jgi:TonB family protein
LIHNGGYGNQKNIAGTNFQQKGLVLRDAAQNPLFILDGKEVSKEEIERLNPNRIERVDVLKDASAIAIYGEKGRHGVVEIKTRNQTSGEPMSLRTNGQEVLRGNITNLEFMDSNKVYFEAQDIVVNNKKSNAADTVPQKEVIVRGYKKTPATKEVTVQGRRLDSEIVFEKAEFAPSIDRDEWRKFLEKYTMQIITEIGQKAAPGRYTVYVRFIVEKDGSVTNVSTLNDPGYGLNRKVLEIMKHAPKWKPAIQNERVVRSYHTQPITFVIDEVET